MKIVKYHKEKPNIRVGSIITAYDAGYHEVIQLYEKDNGNKVVDHIKVLTSKGNPAKSKKVFTCHVDWCILVDPNKIYNDEKRDAYEKYMALSNLVKSKNV